MLDDGSSDWQECKSNISRCLLCSGRHCRFESLKPLAAKHSENSVEFSVLVCLSVKSSRGDQVYRCVTSRRRLSRIQLVESSPTSLIGLIENRNWAGSDTRRKTSSMFPLLFLYFSGERGGEGFCFSSRNLLLISFSRPSKIESLDFRFFACAILRQTRVFKMLV